VSDSLIPAIQIAAAQATKITSSSQELIEPMVQLLRRRGDMPADMPGRRTLMPEPFQMCCDISLLCAMFSVCKPRTWQVWKQM
jgi:hypothetical protein